MFKTRLEKFLCKFNYGIRGEILKFSMLYRSIVIRMGGKWRKNIVSKYC